MAGSMRKSLKINNWHQHLRFHTDCRHVLERKEISESGQASVGPRLRPVPSSGEAARRLVFIASLCFSVFFAATVQGAGLVSEGQQEAIRTTLPGEWTADYGKAKLILVLTEEGGFALDDRKGRYVVEGSSLVLRSTGKEDALQFEITGDQLTLSGSDLPQPLKFTRVPKGGKMLNWLFDFSAKSAKRKLFRMLLVGAVAIGCRLLLFAIRGLSRFIICSERGFLKYLYSRRKNRAMTINSLILNLLKYIVYFSALGFILTEMGINYTAYLASLSFSRASSTSGIWLRFHLIPALLRNWA